MAARPPAIVVACLSSRPTKEEDAGQQQLDPPTNAPGCLSGNRGALFLLKDASGLLTGPGAFILTFFTVGGFGSHRGGKGLGPPVPSNPHFYTPLKGDRRRGTWVEAAFLGRFLGPNPHKPRTARHLSLVSEYHRRGQFQWFAATGRDEGRAVGAAVRSPTKVTDSRSRPKMFSRGSQSRAYRCGAQGAGFAREARAPFADG